MNEEFDPTLEIGISGTGLSEQETNRAVANIQAADIELKRPTEEEVAEEQAVEATTPEPIKENEGPTAGDYVADTFIGLGAGARDIASNIITTPERVIDFFNGEMEAEGKDYDTEWDDFMYGDGDPIETKTWWGGLVRGATDVVGTIATTGKIGKAVGLLSKAKQLNQARTLGSTLKEGALLGLRYDLVAKNEGQDNLTGTLKQHYGWLDTPFATNDTDHPGIRKLKHIVEGMGIGAVFDATRL